MKTRGAAESARSISDSYEKLDTEELRDLIDKVAIENDLCVEMLRPLRTLRLFAQGARRLPYSRQRKQHLHLCADDIREQGPYH